MNQTVNKETPGFIFHFFLHMRFKVKGVINHNAQSSYVTEGLIL